MLASTEELGLPRGLVIDGKVVQAESSFGVINPATGQEFARAPSATQRDVDAAFAAAARAFSTWKRDDALRCKALMAAADAIAAATPRLAAVLTAEQGKPLADATKEIATGVAWIRYFANLELPREIVQDNEQGYAEVVRRPLGVVAAITPWNFPIVLAIWKIAPALRVGNTMVLKPSPYTPLTTLLLGEVMQSVLPAGVFSVLTGPDPLGAALTAHPYARKISFTGSTATGKRVAAAAADDLKRVTLELGGNDPAIVLEDAKVEDIADSLFWGAFMNNGQVCLAVKRVYVHESLHDDLVDALAERARNVKVDAGTAEGAQLGPLNNRAQFDRVGELVADALGNGAVAAAGGQALDRPGYFFAPTILHGLADGARIVDEEQFGPALPIVSYRTVDEAVARANRSHFGLTASVWSPDIQRASLVAAELETGQVSVNAHGAGVRPDLPFGGHKWSGIGVENGLWGLAGFTELQVITRPRIS